MTTFTITPSTSVYVTGGGNKAFSSDPTGDDILDVMLGAYLISEDDVGAFFGNDGGWKLKVNGSIFGGSLGVQVAAGNAKVSKIQVGVDGQIGSDIDAVLSDSLVSITNAGTIHGGSSAIVLTANATGTSKIVNSGTISGGVSHAINLVNSFSAALELTNSGTIVNNVVAWTGDDTVTNSGLIQGNVALGTGVDMLTNSGNIYGQVTGNGTNTVINSGTISAIGITGTSLDIVKNTGTIDVLDLGNGTNQIFNGGVVESGVAGGSDTDAFTNAMRVGKKAIGGTVDSSVDLSAGDDIFTNIVSFKVKVGTKTKTVTASGEVSGSIDLGSGNDTFIGGTGSDTVQDNDGNDDYRLGSGNDTYIATGNKGSDGSDTVNGGAGTDLYDASGSLGQPVIINLSTSIQNDPGIGGPTFFYPLAANSASGASIGNDTVIEFEDARGGSKSDVIFGSDKANVLQGGAGDDYLYGLAGNDRLEGEAGTDNLVGGAGRDVLSGGTEADTFWYFAASDSGTTAATRDLIVDFADDGPGGEVINLSKIDAIPGGGEDKFSYIGPNVLFSSTAGELRSYYTATGHIIEGDIDGDGKADFSIEVADPGHAIVFSNVDGDDFVL